MFQLNYASALPQPVNPIAYFYVHASVIGLGSHA